MDATFAPELSDSPTTIFAQCGDVPGRLYVELLDVSDPVDGAALVAGVSSNPVVSPSRTRSTNICCASRFASR